jgi:hypothetical protein
VNVHLLVELEDLPNWRINGIYCAIMQIPGVKMACTLETIGRETLDQYLMPSQMTIEGQAVPKPKRRKAAS